MTTGQIQRGGSSCALQGCLFGSVALFVVLLIFLLILGYQQFRENTQPQDDIQTAPVSGAIYVGPKHEV